MLKLTILALAVSAVLGAGDRFAFAVDAPAPAALQRKRRTESELQFLQGLRQAGLSRLAGTHLSKLQATEPAVLQPVTAGIELSRTLAARAKNTRAPQRQELWRQAEQAVANVKDVQTDDRILLDAQRALLVLEQAEWARREAEVLAHEDEDWLSARAVLRRAVKLWRGMTQTLQRPSVRRGVGQLNATRVEELLRNANFHLARAYQNQGLTYPADSLDRTNSLTQADRLWQALATPPVMDALAWRARLGWIRCCRLLGELHKAQQLLQGASEIPDQLLGDLTAESIRLALAAGQPQLAGNLFRQAGNAQASSPELALAQIETLAALAASSDAGETSPDALYREAGQQATLLEQRFGTYWGLRGEMLITRLNAGSKTGQNEASLLARTARTMLRRQQYNEAVELYQQGAAQSRQAGRADEAFDQDYQAANILHQRGQLDRASRCFETLALSAPEHDRAASAHQLACFDAAAQFQALAKQASNQASTQQALVRYRSLLRQHLEHWPESDSANQVRLWLGRLASAEGDWQVALDSYQSIDVNAPQAADALRQWGQLYRERLPRDAQEFPEWLSSGRSWIRGQLANNAGRSLRHMQHTEAAKLYMLYQPYDYGRAAEQLDLAISTAAPSDDRDALKAALVVALAGSQQASRGMELLASTARMSPRALLGVLSGMLPIRDQRPQDRIVQQIVRMAYTRVTETNVRLTEPDKLLLQQTRADLMPDEAARVAYASLAAAHPDHARIGRRYAELLSDAGPKAQQAALRHWRQQLSKSPKRSTAWFRAKLGIAETHLKLGDKKQARQILQLTMTLYPDLGSPSMQQSFQSLLEQCK